MGSTRLIVKAESHDAEQIAALVNVAYRGEVSKQGWTTEADLLDGCRTTAEDVLRLITDEGSMFLLFKAKEELIGTVHLKKQPGQAYLSMLAVSPLWQGRGIGKQLLAAAELTTQQSWNVSKWVMDVVSCRHELIAFYQRRGYRRTGISQTFPLNPELWSAKVSGLRLELLEKNL